jgi:hypothetical protein
MFVSESVIRFRVRIQVLSKKKKSGSTTSVLEPCHFAWIRVPKKILRFRVRFLPFNFKFTTKTPVVDLVFVSSLASFMPGSASVPSVFSSLGTRSFCYYVSTVKMKRFLRQESKPKPRARIRFKMGQNDMVPVPQHYPHQWFQIRNWLRIQNYCKIITFEKLSD